MDTKNDFEMTWVFTKLFGCEDGPGGGLTEVPAKPKQRCQSLTFGPAGAA